MIKKDEIYFYDIENFCIIINKTDFKWFFRDGIAKVTSFRPN
jgi:hypothetical protein